MSDLDRARQFFLDGLARQQGGDLAAAESAYRQALALAPDRPSILTNLVAVLIAGGRHQAAQGECARLLAVDPDNVAALNNAGICARQLGDDAAALAHFDRALALKPDYVEAHVNRGIALSALGRNEEALATYARALELAPDTPEALVNRGIVLQRLDRAGDALADLDRAVLLQPTSAEALNSRGNALRQLGRPGEALGDFERALRLRPEFPEALDNRGSALRELGRLADAIDSYDRAIRLTPDNPALLRNRGHALQDAGRPEEALESYDRALALAPDDAEALLVRASVLNRLGRREAALAAYDLARAAGADAAQIAFDLAAMGAAQMPGAPPRDYVSSLFDGYAERFDQHLTGTLKYRIPEVLAAAIGAHLPRFPQDIVDLGCGTGLVGPHLRAMARTLDGVDLSEKMVAKARARGVYDRLAVGDLVEFLHAHVNAYDVAVAADVFVYVGDLTGVFAGVRQAVRSGGLFGFSVESVEEGDYVLQPTRRYAHSRAYVETLAAAHGFVPLSLAPETVRSERGVEIDGIVAVLRAI